MAEPQSTGAASEPFDAEKNAEMTETFLRTHFQPSLIAYQKWQLTDEEFSVLNTVMLKQTLNALIAEVDNHEMNNEDIPVTLQIRLCRFKIVICQSNRARARRWEKMGFNLPQYALDRLDREELLLCALRVEHRLLMQLFNAYFTDGSGGQSALRYMELLERFRQDIRNSGQPWGRCPSIVESRRDLKPLEGQTSDQPASNNTAVEREYVPLPNSPVVQCQGQTHRRYYRQPGQCKLCDVERFQRLEARVNRRRMRESNRVSGGGFSW
ncbi:hypothetical protein V8F20_001873 [Naviculisporaceae sp. PSN 640]